MARIDSACLRILEYLQWTLCSVFKGDVRLQSHHPLYPLSMQPGDTLHVGVVDYPTTPTLRVIPVPSGTVVNPEQQALTNLYS